MTVQAPEYVGLGGAGWTLTDYARRIGTAQATAGGAGTVTFPAVDAGAKWEITRAVIAAAGSSSGSTCRFYVVPAGTSPAQQYEVSGTNTGLFDEADYPGPGLWVLEGEQLLAVWAGAPANAALTVNLQLRLMRRT